MDLNAAAIFVKVVETGGFTAAGQALGIPKTTVSKKLGDLEASLGARLLNRTTRRVSLTEVGEVVHRHMLLALAQIDAAERAVQSAQQAPRGMLTIGGPAAVAVPFLMPAILAFMAAYPDIIVTNLSVDSPGGIDDDSIDVLLTVAQGESIDARDRAIVTVEIGLFASTAYLERQGRPAAPGDLRRHHALAPTQAMAGNRFVWALAGPGARITVTPDTAPRLRSNDAGALAAAAAEGLGIAPLSLRLVDALGDGAGLERVLPDWQVPGITLYARRRDGSAGSLKNRLFVEFVIDWFRTH